MCGTRGYMPIGIENRYRLNSEYHKALALLYSQLREQVNNVHMVVSPLWCGLGNIYGCILVG